MKVYTVKMGKKKTIEKRILQISDAKKELKKNEVALSIAEKYGLDDIFEEIVDGMPVSIDEDLESSAKTSDGQISLSEKALKDIMKYLIHEFAHVCQHISNEGKTKKIKRERKKPYLDRENEKEAFKFQIKHQIKEDGLSETEEYIEDLLDFHKIPKKSKKRKTLKNMLLGKKNDD